MPVKINEGFPLIHMDAPWSYENEREHNAALGGMPYDTMSTRDICALRPLLDRVVAKDSVLLMWATLPKLPEAIQVMAAYGYKFTCVPFVWIKLNPTGELWQPMERHIIMNAEEGEAGGVLKTKDVVLKGGVYSGMGSYVNGNAEIVIMGKRGRGCPRQAKNIKQIVFAPRGAHSAKPEEVRTRIGQVFGDATPKLELFARPPIRVKGCWLKLGNEISGNDIREDLQQLAAGTYCIPKEIDRG